MNSNSRLETGGILFGHLEYFDLDVLPHLESDLDINEKVSLVFLLYDDIPVAIQKLFVMLTSFAESPDPTSFSTNLLHDWACSERTQWKEKLVEALLIIKAYSNIDKLLLSIDELKCHFLPHVLHTSLHVHPVKKVLFNICESLSHSQLETTLNLIRQDAIRKNICFTETYNNNATNVQYFELCLLDLLECKYICVYKQDQSTSVKREITNLNNLINILDSAGFKTFAGDLKFCQDLVNGIVQDDEDQSSMINMPSTSRGYNIIKSDDKANNSEDINHVANIFHHTSLESIYTIHDDNNVGLIFIINQIKFSSKNNPSLAKEFTDRTGSLADENSLVHTWKSFGFKSIVSRNLKKEAIFAELQSILNDMVESDHSCFVLCILSHGKKGSIISSDCHSVQIESIEKMFDTSKAPKLAGKPKLLLIQSCQGESKLPTVDPRTVKIETGNIEADGPQSNENINNFDMPEKSDMLTFYSTVRDYESFRHTEDGSWFIQALCHHMDKVTLNASQNFVKICVGVTKDVTSKRFNRYTQTPQYHSTLTKDLYLKRISM